MGKTPSVTKRLLLTKTEEIEAIKNVARTVTVDLVRSEDFALKEYLESHVYFKCALGDIKANPFTAYPTVGDKDIEPLTYNPDAASFDKSRDYGSVGQFPKSRLKGIKI